MEKEMTCPVDIKSMNLDELTVFIKELGLPPFRAKQIYEWIHVKLLSSFSEMTNLSKDLRQKLEDTAKLTVLKPLRQQISKVDKTKKYLFELEDGNSIESVRMEYKHGCSVCISSQVGCAMGCSFCASTIDGLVRNLTPAEMLDQVYRIQDLNGKRVDNIVVMGAGEPLQNFDNLVKFLGLINDEKGLNISMRNITVSTCGLVPAMKKLARLHLPITLAVSLHAPNDIIRKSMMPVADSFSMEDLIDACKYYINETGRRITFEYALIRGVNDSSENALELARLLRGINCHVNIINVNPIKERDYEKTAQECLSSFTNLLEKNRINVTIRRELGQDIDGSCGQLRRRYLE